jgi:LemA protein
MSLASVVWVILGIIGLVLLWLIFTYNRLVVLRNRINNAWSQMDVQLRRRYDLIPNLVETVKGYAAHERETFEMVTKARAAVTSAQTVADQAQAQNMITAALKTLFAVAENYPELRASQNFMMLQEELSGVEGKIAYSRQFYNDTVLLYNNAIQVFPTSMIAGGFGFGARDYFEMEAAARAPVQVSFRPPQPPQPKSP